MTLKKKIEKLISLIKNTDIEEIEVSSFWGAQKIRLSKKNTFVKQPDSPPAENLISHNVKVDKEVDANEQIDSPVDLKETNSQKEDSNLDVIQDDYSDENKFKIIKAPLVGTFYLSPKPGDPPFVNTGDYIEEGKVLCIIEAMKIFNDIESEFSGKLVEIYIEDASPVEYGQELFVLEV